MRIGILTVNTTCLYKPVYLRLQRENFKMEKYLVPSDEELDQLFKRTTSDFKSGYINVQGFVLPQTYLKFQKSINEFQVFDSDVWICGFPKSGTTWMAEIAWLISHDLDYEGAKMVSNARYNNLDPCFLYGYGTSTRAKFFEKKGYAQSIDTCKALTNPRQIKSHLPFPLLPEDIRNGRGKVICAARNPMDVCVSNYYQWVNFGSFSGTLDEFCKLFLYGKVNYGPHAKHVLSFWEVRNNPNIFFITYEEMKEDLTKALRAIAQFLGKHFSEDDLAKLAKHVSFDSMKRNPAVNKAAIMKEMEANGYKLISPFIRKGKVGGYKSEMSPNWTSQFHYWMPKQFEGSGLQFLGF